MRLGFYTYSYTDRLAMPIVPCLERIAKTGYSGIDVSGTHGNSESPMSVTASLRKSTRDAATRLGLRIEAVITHAQLTDNLVAGKPLDLKGTVDLAVELGADVVTFHMGGYPAGVARDAFWKQVVEVLRRATDDAAARHVKLAVDGLWTTWIVDTPDALARLFDNVGNDQFGVNFDPSYLTLLDIDAIAFVKRFSSRIFHAHLKDHRITKRGGKLPEWTHLIPGKGEMKYAEVFAALDRVRFGGSCAVECFTDMKFEAACDEGFRDMTAAAHRAGVRFSRKM